MSFPPPPPPPPGRNNNTPGGFPGAPPPPPPGPGSAGGGMFPPPPGGSRQPPPPPGAPGGVGMNQVTQGMAGMGFQPPPPPQQHQQRYVLLQPRRSRLPEVISVLWESRMPLTVFSVHFTILTFDVWRFTDLHHLLHRSAVDSGHHLVDLGMSFFLKQL